MATFFMESILNNEQNEYNYVFIDLTKVDSID